MESVEEFAWRKKFLEPSRMLSAPLQPEFSMRMKIPQTNQDSALPSARREK
jgi:hypothetical protein